MTVLSAKRPKRPLSSHRTYVKDWDWDRHVVPCTRIDAEDLAQMAESMDEFAVYQVGPNTLPSSEVSRITEPLRALAWPDRDLLTDPKELRRILARQLTDRLARLKIKTGRHVLAGVVLRVEEGNERKLLVLVIASGRVESCDLELIGRQAAA